MAMTPPTDEPAGMASGPNTVGEPAAHACPPHYWLIEERQGQQRWTCHRCGARRDQITSPQEPGGRWRVEPG
jgi:hypothetical protein